MEGEVVDRAAAYTAFAGERKIVSGTAAEVAVALAGLGPGETDGEPVVFDDRTGRQVDFDLRGTDAEIAERYAEPAREGSGAPEARGRGRPKLGVVGKEVTLLPRHWAWLRSQRGGASATLRRLVEEARRRDETEGLARSAQDAAYRFMAAALGNAGGFEEATRALYAADRNRFEALSEGWPVDLRDYARDLAAPLWDEGG